MLLLDIKDMNKEILPFLTMGYLNLFRYHFFLNSFIAYAVKIPIRFL